MATNQAVMDKIKEVCGNSRVVADILENNDLYTTKLNFLTSIVHSQHDDNANNFPAIEFLFLISKKYDIAPRGLWSEILEIVSILGLKSHAGLLLCYTGCLLLSNASFIPFRFHLLLSMGYTVVDIYSEMVESFGFLRAQMDCSQLETNREVVLTLIFDTTTKPCSLIDLYLKRVCFESCVSEEVGTTRGYRINGDGWCISCCMSPTHFITDCDLLHNVYSRYIVDMSLFDKLHKTLIKN